jgi:hypothetical protein
LLATLLLCRLRLAPGFIQQFPKRSAKALLFQLLCNPLALLGLRIWFLLLSATLRCIGRLAGWSLRSPGCSGCIGPSGFAGLLL